MAEEQPSLERFWSYRGDNIWVFYAHVWDVTGICLGGIEEAFRDAAGLGGLIEVAAVFYDGTQVVVRMREGVKTDISAEMLGKWAVECELFERSQEGVSLVATNGWKIIQDPFLWYPHETAGAVDYIANSILDVLDAL